MLKILREEKDFSVCTVPKGLRLIDISKNAKFALLGIEKFPGLSYFEIIHLPTGKKYRVHLPDIPHVISSIEASQRFNSSLFSPDENYLILQTISPLNPIKIKTFLYNISENWHITN